MLNNTFIFLVAISMAVGGATMAATYSAQLAKNYRLSKYAIGFIILAIISILPETIISINSALNGIPSFGLGVLFGSNVADLTLIFAIIILYAGRGLKIESKILKNHLAYPFVLLFPLLLGLDGYFSRAEGLALILVGALFYYSLLRNNKNENIITNTNNTSNNQIKSKNLLLLLLSMIILLIGAHFTVTSATNIAYAIGISPILIGILIVGLGTTIPELFFSLQSIKKQDDSMAIGDILGGVLADATIVIGITALIQPFFFQQKLIYVTGLFMFVASCILFHFMRTGRNLSKREGCVLLSLWFIFVLIEFLVNT